MCRCLWRPEWGVGSPEAVVIGGCEPPDVAGSQTWILWKSSKALLTTEPLHYTDIFIDF